MIVFLKIKDGKRSFDVLMIGNNVYYSGTDGKTKRLEHGNDLRGYFDTLYRSKAVKG